MQGNFQSNVASLGDDDWDGMNMSGLQAGARPAARPALTGRATGKPGKPAAKSAARANMPSSGNIAIDKAVGSIQCSLAAACKVRKATLKDFNAAVAKIDAAKAVCETVMSEACSDFGSKAGCCNASTI